MQPMNIIVCSLRIGRERPADFQGAGCHLEKVCSVQSIQTGAAVLKFTPEEGGKLWGRLTQFGRAMQQLGIMMIPPIPQEARGRSERMFRTHQDRLTRELACHHITSMEEANRYIRKIYLPAHNREFKQKSRRKVPLYPWVGAHLENILCEHHERTVTPDSCVSFEGMTLRFHRTSIVVIMFGQGSTPPLYGRFPGHLPWSEKTGRL